MFVVDLTSVVSLESGVLRSLFGISFLVLCPLFIAHLRFDLLLLLLLSSAFVAIIVNHRLLHLLLSSFTVAFVTIVGAIVCFCSRLLNFLVEAIGSTN